MARSKKIVQEVPIETKTASEALDLEIKDRLDSGVKTQFTPEPPAMEKLLAKVEALEQKDVENQKQLKMLYEVADKGRVVNYESKNVEKKPFKVKLSVYKDGIITGWRTVKDELVKHPTTGLTIGEVQEFEVLILDKEDSIQKAMISGYPAFSEARYGERIEVVIISKSDDFQGNTTFDVQLPDGRIIKMDARFVN